MVSSTTGLGLAHLRTGSTDNTSYTGAMQVGFCDTPRLLSLIPCPDYACLSRVGFFHAGYVTAND